VVIGPRWLTLTDEAGRRRIDNPEDWIRREIVEAFSCGLWVIPVLTGGATLPAKEDLPADISGLSRRQCLPLRHRHTTADLDLLVERITEADPELAAVAARRRSATGRVPQQLPAAVTHFAGRTAELATLTGLLRGRADRGGTVVISAISGTAGVGKTTLTNLGDTHHAAGNPQAARDAWHQALAILDDLEDPHADQLRTKLASLDTPNP